MCFLTQKQSVEGIQLGDYKWGHALLGAPFALLISVWARVVTPFLKESFVEPPSFGPKTLIIGVHPDLMNFFGSKKMWGLMGQRGAGGFSWIGMHDWRSYAGSFDLALSRQPAFRYTRGLPKRPYQQILEHLKKFSGPVFMRTDAGGPYGKIRESAIRLARESGRDLLLFRQVADRGFVLNHHFVPNPGATVFTRWSRVFAHTDIQNHSDLELQKELQKVLEELGKL